MGGTGKEQQIRIQASGGLSESEIEKMVKDAEFHAEEDKKRKEFVESKNQAEALLHSTEKNLSEYGDKITQEEKDTINEKLDTLKVLLKDKDVDKDELKKSQESLIQASMKLGEAMYKSSDKDKEDVDADFEDVSDKKENISGEDKKEDVSDKK